jgi:probable HAF family extracellular repeat protein
MTAGDIRRRVLASGVAVSALVAPGAAFAQIPCGYEVTEIRSDLDCGHSDAMTLPLAMNEQGVVVGYHQCTPWEDGWPFLWTAESGFTNIGPPEGYVSASAEAVNDAMQIAGTMGCGSNPCRAFLYEDGIFIDLGVVPGGTWSQAHGLNDDAQVVGTSSNPWEAVLWEDGEMTVLDLPWGPHGTARDINDDGKVVGYMGGDWHGFLWEEGEVVDLGVIPGGSTSQAIALNNLPEPQVVGWGALPNPNGGGTATHAFLWERGEMIDLGTLPGALRSFALDINDDSVIVGFSDHGFVWYEGVMRDLNELVCPDLGIDIHRARAIDNAGRIVATGVAADTIVVGWLLTPVDAPLGDLDGDCRVGFGDLLALLAAWGPCVDCDECPADLDNDCSVGTSDLLLLLTGWS